MNVNAPLKKKMTVDEFIPWAMAQPQGRFELINGEVVAMSPERVRHSLTKGLVFVSLRSALLRSGVPCECVPDGPTVRINEATAFEPDALVYCGKKVSGDNLEIINPIIVVEVVSPSSAATDTGVKFHGYFSLPSVAHYLIVDPEGRTIVHHKRTTDGQIVSVALTEGALTLDPPGIVVAVADMLSAE